LYELKQHKQKKFFKLHSDKSDLDIREDQIMATCFTMLEEMLENCVYVDYITEFILYKLITKKIMVYQKIN